MRVHYQPPVLRKFVRSAVALILLSAFTLGATADPPQANDPGAQPAAESGHAKLDTVTVQTEKQRQLIEHQISTYVSKITLPTRDESLARWTVAVCPLVAGLPRDKAEFILTRVSQIAREAGIPLGPEKCAPNFFIIATAQPEVLLRKWWARNPQLFTDGRGLGEVKRFISKPQPVRVWHNANTECGGGALTVDDGSELTVAGGAAAPTCSKGNSESRLKWEKVRNIQSVIEVVDLQHINGINIGQLSDYIALIGLAQIRENADPGDAPTILRLFTAAVDARPQAMSTWDQSFLKSLYDTDSSSITQVATIKFRLFKDLVP